MLPQMKGPLTRKHLKQTFVVLITKYVSLYENGVNN